MWLTAPAGHFRKSVMICCGHPVQHSLDRIEFVVGWLEKVRRFLYARFPALRSQQLPSYITFKQEDLEEGET